MWTARLLLLASLFAPAALGEFGSLQIVCVCVYVDMQMWAHILPLAFCDWRGLKPYHNFVLLLFKCQILSANCTESLRHYVGLLFGVYLAPLVN